MNFIYRRALPLALLASFAISTATAFADPETDTNKGAAARNLLKMSDSSADGMVTREQVMKEAERAFNKADRKKMGKMSKTQLQLFMEEWARYPGG